MDSHINPTTRDTDNTVITDLENAIYLRVTVPLGSYWADTSIGSRLHELAGKKRLPRYLVLAKQYAQSALQPLVDSGRADKLDVTASWGDDGRLAIQSDVYQNGVFVSTFKHYVGVVS